MVSGDEAVPAPLAYTSSDRSGGAETKGPEGRGGKISKARAEYRAARGTGPHKGERCGTCRYMQETGGCDKVIGNVAPYMVCDLWQGHAAPETPAHSGEVGDAR